MCSLGRTLAYFPFMQVIDFTSICGWLKTANRKQSKDFMFFRLRSWPSSPDAWVHGQALCKGWIVLAFSFFFFNKNFQVCDIGDASRGSLSSYAYILMMIFYLQVRMMQQFICWFSFQCDKIRITLMNWQSSSYDHHNHLLVFVIKPQDKNHPHEVTFYDHHNHFAIPMIKMFFLWSIFTITIVIIFFLFSEVQPTTCPGSPRDAPAWRETGKLHHHYINSSWSILLPPT